MLLPLHTEQGALLRAECIGRAIAVKRHVWIRAKDRSASMLQRSSRLCHPVVLLMKHRRCAFVCFILRSGLVQAADSGGEAGWLQAHRGHPEMETLYCILLLIFHEVRPLPPTRPAFFKAKLFCTKLCTGNT